MKSKNLRLKKTAEKYLTGIRVRAGMKNSRPIGFLQ
jgi:hypothetical protein